MRSPIVVDTNVLLVANGGISHSRACSLECAKELLRIRQFGAVVLDYGHEILTEYGKKQTHTAQPGIGFQFWKWLLNTRSSSDHCQWVHISKVDIKGYVEFPDHEDLTAFDRSDRKFVAASVAHGGWPPIAQAADSKWWGWKAALDECGVTVKFLCPQETRTKFHKKAGNA